MNAECVFINHKFLFRTFSFRNSEYIDLFPVFIKDILPFVLTRDNAEYIGNIYDDVMKGIQRHGKTNLLEDSYKKGSRDLIWRYNILLIRLTQSFQKYTIRTFETKMNGVLKLY